MTERHLQNLAILGAGSWGTALAHVALRGSGAVCLYGRDPEVISALQTGGSNPRYLPGISLSGSFSATLDLEEATRDRDAVLLVVPSQAIATVIEDLAKVVAAQTPIVLCAKGLDTAQADLLSDVVLRALPESPVAVLSGPTFAREVAQGLPTAVTIASTDAARAPETSLTARLGARLGAPNFRPYLSDDVIGVEVAGAIKNVLAIACGIAQGRALGANAGATLLTRGLAELARLTVARGGRPETVMGPAGLGDLALTCSNTTSRNMRFGIAIGEGKHPEDVLAASDQVVEGYHNTATVKRMAARLGVELPICDAVHAVLHEGQALDTAIAALLSRPFKTDIGVNLPGASID